MKGPKLDDWSMDFFWFHFGCFFGICEEERWWMWIRKMTRGMDKLSVLFQCFGRSCSDCGQEHRWFDQSSIFGEFGALEISYFHGRFEGKNSACVVLFGNGSTVFTFFGDIAWHNLMTRTLDLKMSLFAPVASVSYLQTRPATFFWLSRWTKVHKYWKVFHLNFLR